MLTCKAIGIEPYDYLKDVLGRLPTMTNRQVPDITPHAWAKTQRTSLKSAAYV